MQKYNVEIFIACRKHAQIYTQAKKVGLKVVCFDFSSSFDIKTIFALVKFIKENDIDILNSHSGKDTWVGGIAAKIAGIKFIRTRHLSLKINPSRLNFINSLADFIFTTGENVRSAMIKENRINPSKILSIPTGVDSKRFDPKLYSKKASRQEFSFDDDKIYIGTLAVLRQVKRIDIVLDIALNIKDRYKNVVFVIAGDGPKKNDFIKFIKDNNLQDSVKLLGHITDQPKFLNAIDLFLLTSQSEGVPQSLMQALFMQKPSIATDVGGVRDLFCDENFILVPFDKQAIENALIDLLEDKNKIKRLQDNSRAFVEQNFTKTQMAKKIYKVYKNLLGI